MNIIICGLAGTGKTTIAKTISQEHNYKYISDYDIIKNQLKVKSITEEELLSKKFSSDIINYITKSDNHVYDLEYSIELNNLLNNINTANTKIVCLGFLSVEENILFNLFRSNSNNKYSDNELRNKIHTYKNLSIECSRECNKNNIKFFDINRQKSEIIPDILDFINS